MKKWIVIIILLIAGASASGYLYLNSGKETTENADSAVQVPAESTQPSGTKTVTVIISDTNSLTTLSSALKAAAIEQTLAGVGPYTIIAPSDDAFKALSAGTLVALLKPDNVKQLTSILNYHVIAGNITKSQLTNGQRLKTLNGQELTVELDNNKIYFIDAKGGKALVEKADIKASNGTVHVVNAVLLPQ